MAPHSSTFAWKIPWTEEPGGLQSMGSLRVWHNWATSLWCIGEGNGNPLQCSYLENPRDGGAWWAAVYGVAQSRTRLRRLSSSGSSLPLGLSLGLGYWKAFLHMKLVSAALVHNPHYNHSWELKRVGLLSLEERVSWFSWCCFGVRAFKSGLNEMPSFNLAAWRRKGKFSGELDRNMPLEQSENCTVSCWCTSHSGQGMSEPWVREKVESTC